MDPVLDVCVREPIMDPLLVLPALSIVWGRPPLKSRLGVVSLARIGIALLTLLDLSVLLLLQ
jgi:hypothetical protein